MATEAELEAQLQEIQNGIAAQGLKVKGLKDQVKDKKKAKVCEHPMTRLLCSFLQASSAQRRLFAHSATLCTSLRRLLEGTAVPPSTHQIRSSERVQESTAEIDQQVADAVTELKALKASVTDVEVQIEAVTGIPRNKEAFREAVVRPRRCQLALKL